MVLRIFLCICFFYHVKTWAQNDTVVTLYNDWQNSSLFSTQDLPKDQLQHFVTRAKTLCKNQPDNANACALSGMIQTVYTSQVSNLEGLKVAKQARDDLQHALAIDPHVFQGDAYAELASLYHKTPGWPFSFGSQLMAERLLNKALEVDPQGLMSNLRCGEFWFDQKNYTQAQECFDTAFAALPAGMQQKRIDFQLWQARQMLAKIHQ
jgi:tetratricopeptide (TPR) repeat protein